MFINANPRIVSNGFETFVPNQRVESRHRRPIEMKNNDINAWSVFRSGSSIPNTWYQQNDGFTSEENFSNQTLCGGYFQDTYSSIQSQDVNFPKTISYSAANQGRRQSWTKPSSSQQAYQDQVTNVDIFEGPSLMTGNDYSQWSLGRGRGGLEEISRGGSGVKDFQYQTLNDFDTTSFTLGSSMAAPQSSYTTEPLAIGDSFSVDRTSPSKVYTNYSPTNTSVDPKALVPLNTPAQSDSTSKNDWWPTIPRNSGDQPQSGFETPLVHDGLPRYHIEQQQQFNDLWNIGSNTYISRSLAISTISPKVLTLNIPPAPISSSGSSQGTMVYLSDSSTGPGVKDDTADYSGSEGLEVIERSIPIRRHRQVLPASPSISRRIVPVLPSNDFPPSKNTKKRSLKSKSGSYPRTRSTPTNDTSVSSANPFTTNVKVPATKSQTPKRIEPKPTKSISHHSWGSSSQSATTEQAIHHRDAKDDFLVRSKLAGMSYKDIRRQGKFTEAESTLRGRFRTLTKHRTARVRKPEWDENDIRLLRRAVLKLTQGSDTSKCRIPWKQVAEYIANNGGSYHFGNATCRKRWDELMGRSGS